MRSRWVVKAAKSAAVFVGCGLLLGACSPGGTGESQGNGIIGNEGNEGNGSATAIGEPENGGTATAPTRPEYGPLDEFVARIFGWPLDDGHLSDAERQVQADAERQAEEEMLAACMAEQGFHYYIIVHPPDFSVQVATPPAGFPAEESREWFEQFGFGISTDPYSWQQFENPDGEFVDPNQEQLDAMSEAEREAWYEALWGPPMEGEWDWSQAGCSGRVQQVLRPATPDQFQALQDEMWQLGDQISSDPRIIALNSEWTACMAVAGEPGYSTIDAIYPQLMDDWSIVQRFDELNEIYANWNWDQYPDGPDPADLPQPDPALVAAFTDREIAVAVASYDCRREVDWEHRYQDIVFDVQQQFVDQHRSELEAWAAYMAEARQG